MLPQVTKVDGKVGVTCVTQDSCVPLPLWHGPLGAPTAVAPVAAGWPDRVGAPVCPVALVVQSVDDHDKANVVTFVQSLDPEEQKKLAQHSDLALLRDQASIAVGVPSVHQRVWCGGGAQGWRSGGGGSGR
jgi:hypothetical protein